MNVNNKPGLKGKFSVLCIDSEGNTKWEQDFPNGITDVGVAYLLNAGFDSGSVTTTWYVGLIDNASFSALSASDTAASHSGWIENQDYSETTRVTWANDATAARTMSNSVSADFSMDATATIKGVFIISVSTKGGSTGTLWSTATFGSNAAVTNGDTLKVTYSING